MSAPYAKDAGIDADRNAGVTHRAS